MGKSVNAARMRAKMNDKKLTNADLAELSGTSESTVKRALNGSSMNAYTLTQIADSLGVREEWLTGDEPEIEPSEPVHEPATSPDEPAATLDDPVVSQEDFNRLREKDMKEVIEAVERIYVERIEDWRQRVEDQRQRIEDQKAMYARSRKECHALLIFIAAIVGFVCAVLAFDIMNPNVGWVRK